MFVAVQNTKTKYPHKNDLAFLVYYIPILYQNWHLPIIYGILLIKYRRLVHTQQQYLLYRIWHSRTQTLNVDMRYKSMTLHIAFPFVCITSARPSRLASSCRYLRARRAQSQLSRKTRSSNESIFVMAVLELMMSTGSTGSGAEVVASPTP